MPAVGHFFSRAVQSPWAWTQGSQPAYSRAQPMPGSGPQWGHTGNYQLQTEKKVTLMFISTWSLRMYDCSKTNQPALSPILSSE